MGAAAALPTAGFCPSGALGLFEADPEAVRTKGESKFHKKFKYTQTWLIYSSSTTTFLLITFQVLYVR
jgi:hypothetical protein